MYIYGAKKSNRGEVTKTGLIDKFLKENLQLEKEQVIKMVLEVMPQLEEEMGKEECHKNLGGLFHSRRAHWGKKLKEKENSPENESELV